MGGSTKQDTTQQQVASTTPWAPAAGAISGILGNLQGLNPNLTGAETGALNRLSAMGAAGNPFAGGIGGVANTLLAGGGPDRTGMVNSAYQQYQQQLSPFTSGQYVDPSQNPELQKYLQVARDDATNAINGQFAAAGRDLSGMNSQALGRGIGQAEAPILYDAYNQARGQQLGAINSLFSGGGQTAGLLSGLDQTRLANEQAGIGAADAANQAQQYGPMLQLQAEAQRRGIPLQTLAAQMGIALPAGQAFGTQVSNTTGQQTTSVPLSQQIIGGAIGGAGLLGGTGAFGNNGWLKFGGGR
jgi:hypothetical protein